MAEGEVRIFVNAKQQAVRALNSVSGAVKGLIASWAGFHTVKKMIDTMKDTVHTFIEYTEAIDKANKITGIATEKLQELKYAAEQEHGSFQALEKGLINLTVRLGYAGDGLETYLRYFRTLGIEYQNADGTLRNTYDVFMDLSDAVSKGTLTTEELAAAVQLFGARSGKELIPMLKKGREWFEKMGDEAHRLGVVLEDETIKQGKELADMMLEIKTADDGVKLAIGERLMPTMMECLPIIREYAVWGSKLIEAYDPVISFMKNLWFNMKSNEEQQKVLNEEIGKGVERLKEIAKELGDDKESKAYKAALEILVGVLDNFNAAAKDGKDNVDGLGSGFDDGSEKVKNMKKSLEEWLDAYYKVQAATLTEEEFKAWIDEYEERLKQLKPVMETTGRELAEDTRNWAFFFVGEVGEAILQETKDKINKMKLEWQDLGNMVIYFGHQFLDSVVDAFVEGKMAWGEFARQFMRDITKMIAKAMLLKAIELIFTAKSGGLVDSTKMQTGGIVHGGAPYRDRIPAMLTPGEFVVNREAAISNRDLLEQINANKQSMGTYNNSFSFNIALGSGTSKEMAEEFLRYVEQRFPEIYRNAVRRRQL